MRSKQTAISRNQPRDIRDESVIAVDIHSLVQQPLNHWDLMLVDLDHTLVCYRSSKPRHNL